MNELELAEFVDAVERRGTAAPFALVVAHSGMTQVEADVANAELERRGSTARVWAATVVEFE